LNLNLVSYQSELLIYLFFVVSFQIYNDKAPL
jgi:hypothetical protein